MREDQWLTSADPQSMYDFIKDRVTERQQRFFVEACRKLCDYGYTDPIYKAAFNSWCTGLLHRQPALDVRADLLREIIGNPFRPMIWRESIQPNHVGIVPMSRVKHDAAWLTWNNTTVPSLVHAMMNEECSECVGLGGRWSINPRGEYKKVSDCLKCDAQGRILRAEPQWDMMPIIADAIEEAMGDGHCHELLDHMRLPIITHCVGCWVVELLMGGMQ